ncbi:MAG: CPBP family intramembrane glutamic endopeptidase [Acidobacteriaceae bacterium]
MLLAAILLILVFIPFAWNLRKDRAEYQKFKALTDTNARQRRFRIWTFKSFLRFGCASILALAILGRLSALQSLPPEFQRLAHFFHSLGPTPSGTISFLSGLAAALILIPLLSVLRARRKAKNEPLRIVTLGDVAPLLPRNWAEIAHAAVMSLNAGFSEELYFRLLLPLLLAILIGHAIPAFVLAALLFGLAHIYQGTTGVIASTTIGLAMVLIYLLTGTIWAAVAAHAFMDLLGLVIRPTLMRILLPRRTTEPTPQAPSQSS